LVTVIGIPAFNEEKNIASIIMKLKKVTDHIIVCNDGSTDMTEEISLQTMIWSVTFFNFIIIEAMFFSSLNAGIPITVTKSYIIAYF
jgi:glycosyltransferase involved in cell wall biosynthesis